MTEQGDASPSGVLKDQTVQRILERIPDLERQPEWVRLELSLLRRGIPMVNVDVGSVIGRVLTPYVGRALAARRPDRKLGEILTLVEELLSDWGEPWFRSVEHLVERCFILPGRSLEGLSGRTLELATHLKKRWDPWRSPVATLERLTSRLEAHARDRHGPHLQASGGPSLGPESTPFDYFIYLFDERSPGPRPETQVIAHFMVTHRWERPDRTTSERDSIYCEVLDEDHNVISDWGPVDLQTERGTDEYFEEVSRVIGEAGRSVEAFLILRLETEFGTAQES